MCEFDFQVLVHCAPGFVGLNSYLSEYIIKKLSCLGNGLKVYFILAAYLSVGLPASGGASVRILTKKKARHLCQTPEVVSI